MRSIYLEDKVVVGEKLHLKGDKVHHLKNVLRLKEGEEVIILSGEGQGYRGQIFQMSKREIILECLARIEEREKTYSIDLGVAQVKKEAMDLILKSACELGVGKVLVLETIHSQRYKLNLERMNKLLVSAMEQSNNFSLPLLELGSLSSLDLSSYDHVYLFSTRKVLGDIAPKINKDEKNLILIGPEAGFSTQELIQFEKLPQLKFINLPTPILRAPTAMNCAVGYLLSRYGGDC
jgi:16S rRNA (uracil1498-N3)-methyltransferase